MTIGLVIFAVLSAIGFAGYVGLRKLGEADEHDRQTEADAA
jgi:hypothetical protein